MYNYSTFLVFKKSLFQWLNRALAPRLLKVWDIFVLANDVYTRPVFGNNESEWSQPQSEWDVPGGSGECFPQLFIQYTMSTFPPKHAIYIHGIPDRRWGRKQRLAVLHPLLLGNVLWDHTYQKPSRGFFFSFFLLCFALLFCAALKLETAEASEAFSLQTK